MSQNKGDNMKYFRIHTSDIAYKTQQPLGLFVAVWRLVEAAQNVGNISK